MTESVRITGAHEVEVSLGLLGPALIREVQVADKAAATVVADVASSKARSIGGVAAHVAPTIAVSAVDGGAGVSVSGPAAAGAEYGGRGRATTQQFMPYVGAGGYFLNAAVTGQGPAVEADYAAALERALVEAGLA